MAGVLRGHGPQAQLPLAPGTNSPDPDPSITVIVNAQVSAPAGGGAAVPVATTVVIQQAGAANTARSATGSSKKASRASIRSARVIATASGKRLAVFVKSASRTARIQIRMYGANGRKVGQVTRTVATNRTVKVSNLRVGSKVKTVKVTLVG